MKDWTHNQAAEQIKALDDELRDWNEGLDNYSFSLSTFCPKSKKKRSHQNNSAGGMTQINLMPSPTIKESFLREDPPNPQDHPDQAEAGEAHQMGAQEKAVEEVLKEIKLEQEDHLSRLPIKGTPPCKVPKGEPQN
jgi:hypothetical protein